MKHSLIRTFVKRVLREGFEYRLNVFDFDNTLCKTDAVKFEDFLLPIMKPQLLPAFDVLRYRLKSGEKCMILTARPKISIKHIEDFLDANGLTGVVCVGVGSSAAKKKSEYIASLLDRDAYDIIEFYDDLPKNVAAVQELQPRFPGIKIISHLVKENRDRLKGP